MSTAPKTAKVVCMGAGKAILPKGAVWRTVP